MGQIVLPFLVLLLILSSIDCAAKTSPVTFERITSGQGLSHNIVNCIFQDRQGFLWFGTREGLNKYDGYSFQVYQHDPYNPNSISSNSIRSICQDRSGNLWIATDFGLSKLDPCTNRFTHYFHNPKDTCSLSDNNLKVVYEDRAGTLWVGTNRGLDKFDQKTRTFNRYAPAPRRNHWTYNRIQAVYEDRAGVLWVGTSQGLSRFDRATERFIAFVDRTRPIDSPDLSGAVEAIYEDMSGRLWLGTMGDGLKEFHRDTQTLTTYTHDSTDIHSLSNNFIFCIREEAPGSLWIGTQYGGLAQFCTRTGRFTRYLHDARDPATISSNTVLSLYQDRSGMLWVGTFAGGLNKVDQSSKKFAHFTHDPTSENSLGHPFVHALCEDRSGAVWIGHPKGVDRLDRKQGLYTHFTYPTSRRNRLSDNTAHCLYEDKASNLWIGLAGGGLKKLNAERDHFTSYYHDPSRPESLPHNKVNTVYHDRSGRLWIGTMAGISQLNPATGQFTNYRPASNSGTPFNVRIIVEDRAGQLWLATDGLHAFDPQTKQFTTYGHPTATGNTIISTLYQDTAGRLWMGLESGGLYQFDRKTSLFTEANRAYLSRIVINGILEDARGNLWLSTRSKGLYQYQPSSNYTRTFDTHNGLQGNDFNAAHCKGAKGNLYFGGNNGFNAFHPDSLRTASQGPPVVITGFKVFDQPRTIVNDVITLPYLDNFFSFDFVALDYTLPEKNQYAYILEGLDKAWSEAGSRRYVSYTNLDPGTYTFRVKAANYDGVWNQQGAAVTIIITPPFWQTRWFITTGIILIALSAGIGHQWRIRQLRQQHKQLEETVQTRTQQVEAQKEELTVQAESMKKANVEITRQNEEIVIQSRKLEALDAMKTQFFANISHELRTPLTLIINPVENLLTQKVAARQQADYHRLIHRNANRLLELINQLLDIAKLEAGRMALNAAPGDLAAFVQKQVLSFAPLAERVQVELRLDTPTDGLWMQFDPDKIGKIITNLLSNALKFTPAGGKVQVSICGPYAVDTTEGLLLARQWIHLRVSDSGVGIPSDQLARVFDRFYQVDSSHTREFEGTGIGLSLTKELVELHGGVIQVTSEWGKGTCFTVDLPFAAEPGAATRESYPLDVVHPHALPDEMHPINGACEASSEQLPNHLPPTDTALPVILLVEDNTDVRHYVRSVLADRYQVLEAADGIDGLSQALVVLPDLVISDLMMPKMDGIALCRVLKTDERTSHIPVMLLTARAAVEHKLKGLENGADAYLIKPFNVQELTLQAKNLIEQRRKLRERFQRELPLQLAAVATTSLDRQFLQRVAGILEANFADSTFNIERFEKEAAMSHVQLYRKLKALTDQAPGEYLRDFRLRKAARLLAQQQGNVSQTAYEVGFVSVSHFTRCFRQLYGIVPSEYWSQFSGGQP